MILILPILLFGASVDNGSNRDSSKTPSSKSRSKSLPLPPKRRGTLLEYSFMRNRKSFLPDSINPPSQIHASTFQRMQMIQGTYHTRSMGLVHVYHQRFPLKEIESEEENDFSVQRQKSE